MQQLRIREAVLRERVAETERLLDESRARERQTDAKLQELELLAGVHEGGQGDADTRLTHLIDLYRRLRTIDKERSQLLASAKPDTHAIKALDNEREAIFQWVRAAMGDPGAVAVAKAGPSREALMAVELARVEVTAAERTLQRAREVAREGLAARGEELRAEAELARARANLARAEARVSGDHAAELKAAQAQVDAAQADFNEAEATVARLWTLQRAGAVARMEVESADLRLRKARTALDVARADVKRLQESH